MGEVIPVDASSPGGSVTLLSPMRIHSNGETTEKVQSIKMLSSY